MRMKLDFSTRLFVFRSVALTSHDLATQVPDLLYIYLPVKALPASKVTHRR